MEGSSENFRQLWEEIEVLSLCTEYMSEKFIEERFFSAEQALRVEEIIKMILEMMKGS